ncbi:D,D-peptidase/D,D-carboxypeptidase VanY-N [Allokutzneria oryzae]|uniref:D,D-peptidase/D,D-carboxypeptidase VanY-N n=1 Tax=Allokutzneria oryzae TaxID=1378989 RepID=A0ABV6A6Y4_9PSEU
MSELRAIPDRPRDRLMRAATRMLAVLLLPAAYLRAPGRARHVACQWALARRFPAEDLTGLAPRARQAFEAARAEAFWQDGQLIGLTSGHRDAAEQHHLFTEQVRRTGSWAEARRWVLPPEESGHVRGIAMDVRPTEGAWWLEVYGGRYDLYRTYDNEWWHFEHHPETGGRPPVRMPHPGAAPYYSATS